MRLDLQPISLESYDVLCTTLRAVRPSVLHAESPGETGADRARLEQDAQPELRRAGYVGPQGPIEEVGELFDLLRRPRLAVDVRLFAWLPGRHEPMLAKWGARMAVRGTRGVAAMVGPTGFRAWSFPPTSLVNEVTRFVPHHDPPPGFGGVTVSLDQLVTGVMPARRGLSEQVRHALEGAYVRRTHLCVVTLEQVVGGERASAGLTLNDAPLGRFLVFADRNQIAIVPGTRVAIERKLRELTEPVRTY